MFFYSQVWNIWHSTNMCTRLLIHVFCDMKAEADVWTLNTDKEDLNESVEAK